MSGDGFRRLDEVEAPKVKVALDHVAAVVLALLLGAGLWILLGATAAAVWTLIRFGWGLLA